MIQNTILVQSRVPEQVKKSSEEVLNRLGLDIATGIRMFLAQVSLRGELPFAVTTNVSADPFYSQENIDTIERRLAEIDSGTAVLQKHDLIGA